MSLRLEDPEADERAIRRFQAGEQDAFDELYRRHRDRLYRFCRYRLHNETEAEDVVQETFARAWRTLPAFGGDRRFYAWLRVIASNLCSDAQRRASRTEVRALGDAGTAPDGYDTLSRDIDAALVRSAVVRLNRRHREALELREWEELSYEEIAARVGVTIGTVESLLWRARQALKRELTALSGKEGVLGGVPVLGWLLRRVRAVHSRLRFRGLRAGPAPIGTGLMAVGAAVAAGVVALVIGGGPFDQGPQLSARPHVVMQGVDSTAADGRPTSPAPPLAGASAAQGAAPAGASPGVILHGVVSLNGKSARSEAQTDPVHTSVGPAYVGVDPAWTAAYTQKQVANTAGAAVTAVSAARKGVSP